MNVDSMVLGTINCLDTDPEVAIHACLVRTLGFFVDTEAGTISLGLARADDHPFYSLYTCPHGEAASLSKFITATRTDTWPTLGTSRPPRGSNVGQRLLIEIVTGNIDCQNGVARLRLRDS